MTTAPVPRLIRGLAVPTIISMLVTSFYVMADTYFVGKINTQSTAAVGISFSIMAIIQAFGFFCGHGSGNFISRRLGARDYRSAEKMALRASLVHSSSVVPSRLSACFSWTYLPGIGFYPYHSSIRQDLFRDYPVGSSFYGLFAGAQ